MTSIREAIERGVTGRPGVEVRGRAEVLSEGGKEIMEDFSEELIRIFPRRVVGWGIDSDAFMPHTRAVD
jgi:pyridoxamine 5'-phosphate oxidase family protein